MYIHLYLTDSCNLACGYCRGKIFDTPELDRADISIDADIPVDVTYDLADLLTFLRKDPEVVVTFIGGEPTLRCDLITAIMDDLPDTRFMIQTNGLLLYRLSPAIVNRFETILVSIDGDAQTTDAGRGKGTYRRVMENIHHILAGGYSGEIIARMTVREPTDILQSVLYLSKNSDYSFSSIHWQIDANFWNDYHIRSFDSWIHESYLPGIRSLVDYWIRQMEESGVVERWYPFIDPVEDMIRGRVSRLRCGSGYKNYTVLTNGQIVPCPIMVGMADYYLGNISDTDPNSLPDIPVPGPCTQCDIFTICGGRCLYSAIMQPWPEKGSALVCQTVREMLHGLREMKPGIEKMIADKRIRLEQFSHEKYNGCEIIP